MNIEASHRNELEKPMSEINIDSKENDDKMESLDVKIDLLASNRNFRTFTVLSSVLSDISHHLMQDSDGVYEKTYGGFYGTMEVPNIVVHKTYCLPPNINEISDEYPLKFQGFDFLGLYSLGDFPNDVDVDKFEAILKNRSRSNFLLKVEKNQETNDISLTAFEAAILPIKKTFEGNTFTKCLFFLQLHRNASCEGIIEKPRNILDKSKTFYIQHLTSRVPEYETPYCFPYEEESTPRKKFPGVTPSFSEYHQTLCNIAQKEGIQAMEVHMKNLKKKAEYLLYLEKIAKRGRIEITFNFRIELDMSKKEERVVCWSTVLDCQIVDIGSNMQKSLFAAVCTTLLSLGAL